MSTSFAPGWLMYRFRQTNCTKFSQANCCTTEAVGIVAGCFRPEATVSAIEVVVATSAQQVLPEMPDGMLSQKPAQRDKNHTFV